jgi:hypothetical protein
MSSWVARDMPAMDARSAGMVLGSVVKWRTWGGEGQGAGWHQQLQQQKAGYTDVVAWAAYSVCAATGLRYGKRRWVPE